MIDLLHLDADTLERVIRVFGYNVELCERGRRVSCDTWEDVRSFWELTEGGRELGEYNERDIALCDAIDLILHDYPIDMVLEHIEENAPKLFELLNKQQEGANENGMA